jgi:hypothetical protein
MPRGIIRYSGQIPYPHPAISNRVSCKGLIVRTNAFWDDFLQMAPYHQLAALVAAVREMGGSGGNIKLRGKLGWDEAAYDAVRDQAIAAGKVKAGSGRGGSGYSQVGVRRSRK